MCGLTAIFAYRSEAPPVDQMELLRIREHMISRGPDGAGLWISDDRRVGFGHRRLAIIDLSEGGAQPMTTADGLVRIVFNGEIYNHRALRKQLEMDGYIFRTASDTEVLLQLYRAHGTDMTSRLRGMYAFAIWDERERALFLARDPFGIKPLYYSDDGNSIRVASQVKALLRGGHVDTAPEPAGHVGFFLWGHVPEPYTLYRGIRSVEAGTSLWIKEAAGTTVRTFFKVGEEIAKVRAASIGNANMEMKERISAALAESVRHHLIADVPVGCFLSSGLDSTTLVALTQQELAAPSLSPFGNKVNESERMLFTITLGFEEFRNTVDDEVPLANLVASRYQTNHQTHWVRKADFQEDYSKLLDAMDQPTVDGINTYFVSKFARKSGLKVALSGLGGDELFGGYPSFRQIPILTKLAGPLRHLPIVGRGFRYISSALLEQIASPKYAGILEYGGTYGEAYLLRRGMYMPWELPNIMDREFAQEGWAELKTISRLERTVRGVDNAHLKISALETCWYMRNQLLRDTDWASMAHSLEIRTPLVDIELFRSVVPFFFGADPPTKQAMAKSPYLPLPEQIMSRQKTGFSIPVRQWLQDDISGSRQTARLKSWAEVVYHRQSGFDRKTKPEPKRLILIFRVGQLGDTLVSMPAISTIRARFSSHSMILLTDRHPTQTGYVSSWDVLGPTGWFDQVIFYDSRERNWKGWKSLVAAATKLRNLNVGHIFNLAPERSISQSIRDKIVFRGMFPKAKYHASQSHRTVPASSGSVIATSKAEWRRLLETVWSGEFEGDRFKLPILERERDIALRIAIAERIDLNSKLVAIGPGSKMQSKKWPTERFREMGAMLLKEFSDLHVVIFGGREDLELGEWICKEWGARAHNLAGKLSIYGSAAILERCTAYVGNDTGTMHLAAMIGTPCVALFSARDQVGKWDPYGRDHTILRKNVECAGCMLEACSRTDHLCLSSITVSEVYAATRSLVSKGTRRIAVIETIN